MTKQPVIRHWPDRVRWILLAVAVVVLVAFLLVQKQSTQVSYGQAPMRHRPDPGGFRG